MVIAAGKCYFSKYNKNMLVNAYNVKKKYIINAFILIVIKLNIVFNIKNYFFIYFKGLIRCFIMVSLIIN